VRYIESMMMSMLSWKCKRLNNGRRQEGVEWCMWVARKSCDNGKATKAVLRGKPDESAK
jgi:hypothetical protein